MPWVVIGLATAGGLFLIFDLFVRQPYKGRFGRAREERRLRGGFDSR